LTIGFLGKPHGSKGFLRLRTFINFKESINGLKYLTLLDSQGKKKSLEVWEIRKYKPGQYLIKLNGFKTRKEVEKFSSKEVAI